MIRIIIAFLCCVAFSNVYAARGYQSAVNPAGFAVYASAATAIANGCVTEIYQANLSYSNVKVGGSDDWGAIALASGLSTAAPGAFVNFTCQAFSGTVLSGTAVAQVIVVQTCPGAGTPASAIYRTTIATWNPAADPAATSAGSMPNPQCSSQCVIEHPSGIAAGAICEGFVAGGVAPAVGVTEWVLCGTQIGFVYTSASCGYASSDYPTMTATATDMPSDAVPVQPDVAAGTAVDTSAICVDADANGYDDDSGVACSVLAAAALDSLAEARKQTFEAVGTGGSLAGDIASLASANGGMFSLPQSIRDFLNPASRCDASFTFGGWAGFESRAVQIGAWCSIKTSIDPFLNFAMYFITIFACFSLYRTP